MADEDEIDILGDFQLDSDSNLYDGGPLISQTSELLNCDYTIHPQWLLDRPSTNPDNWYDDSNTFTNSAEKLHAGELGHLSTENSITDESGWTEKEKNLLERGIEIFGKSNARLSQFIGSKSAPEVKYYLKNFYLENHPNRRISECALEGDVLDDAQIPASIEEVIAAVSTAKPTVEVLTHNRSRKKSRSNSTVRYVSDKESNQDHSPLTYRRKNLLNPKITRKDVKGLKPRKALPNTVKFRIKSKLKTPFKYGNVIKQKTINIVNAKNNENEIKRVEITTGHGLAVPICEGEEIIKLTSEDSDTDVDVELSDNEFPTKSISNPETKTCLTKSISTPETKTLISKDDNFRNMNITNLTKVSQPRTTVETLNLTEIDESLLQELHSSEKPKSEIILDRKNITDLEKLMHFEYFSDSTTKTPERYMQIRNHILQCWQSQKPKYVNKTLSRQTLRNCGDVNSFSKIHRLLEQIGAINFGCDQVNYERPLVNLLHDWMSSKERKKELIQNLPNEANVPCRSRIKKKFNNDGEGGHTMSHDESGQIIKHTIINEEPIKQKQYMKKPTVRLIYCSPFKDEMVQPYKIKINLSTLLTMDFHAHTYLTEVMGLIAGYWVSQSKTLKISHYEPCLNIASSATHCDMCPISQAKAADSIHSKGLDILGWFHSHPTFAPEPSYQDIETQQSVQQWIGQNKPCIGMILSPFSLNGALIASPFRCWIVDKKANFEDQSVPYKFKVDIELDEFEVDILLNNIRRVLLFNTGIQEKLQVDFMKPYYHSSDITFFEKYITSVRMHLAKLGTLDKATCESIINGIRSICVKEQLLITSIEKTKDDL